LKGWPIMKRPTTLAFKSLPARTHVRIEFDFFRMRGSMPVCFSGCAFGDDFLQIAYSLE
jgi:hypothetical protein